MEVEDISCDALVIGGGGAGSRAALEASKHGLSTVLLCKAEVGRSGCSIFASVLDYVGPSDSEGEADHRMGMEWLARYTQYLGDQEYFDAATRFTKTAFYPWLEERGIYILRDESGEILTDVPDRNMLFVTKMGLCGPIIMDLMRKLLRASPVTVRNWTAVTKLVVVDGRCVGAVAFDYRHNKILIVRASSVILATGHSNYLSLRSTATREGVGSGWVLAHEAGARLRNIEMQWYHAGDLAKPATWQRLHMYPNPLPGSQGRARLVNREGEVFFDGRWYPDEPVPYLLQLKRLAEQVHAGKARFDGDYFTTYAHIDPPLRREIFAQSSFVEKLGGDVNRDNFEAAITYHMNVGGVVCDANSMETDVGGLLAAGSVNCLITGGLNQVTYDGIVAASTARALVGPRSHQRAWNQEAADDEVARIRSLASSSAERAVAPAAVKRAIRELMWEDMNYEKTQASMERALGRLQDVREDLLPRMACETALRRWNFALMESLDVFDMLRACALQIQFSMFRKESRGAFYRADFPVTDNARWLRHVTGSKGEDGGLVLRTEPVDLPYARPTEETVDFFAAQY